MCMATNDFWLGLCMQFVGLNLEVVFGVVIYILGKIFFVFSVLFLFSYFVWGATIFEKGCETVV